MTRMELIICSALIVGNTAVVAALLGAQKEKARRISWWARGIVLVGYVAGGAAALWLATLLDFADPLLPFLLIAVHFVWTVFAVFGFLILERRANLENRVEVGDKEPPVVRLVNSILVNAIRKKASSIIIDSDDEETWVSFLINGSPQVEMRPPVKMYPHIIGRLMTMAGLGYSEYGLVSQGHIHLLIGKNQEQFFNVYLKKGSGDQPAALIELTDGQGLPLE